MPTFIQSNNSDYRTKITFGIVVITAILVTPFGVNNFLQGRYLLGIGCAVLVLLCIFTAWLCKHGRHYPLLTFLGTTPALIFYLVFVFKEQGMIGVYWSYPAVIFLYFMLPERLAWIANIVLLGVVFPEAWQVIDPPGMTRFFITLTGVSALAAFFMRLIIDQQHMLEHQAMTDSLTGLLNRTSLHDALEQAIQRGRRTNTPMTLVVLDLDHFKSINDTLGHSAGDSALSGVGKLLQKRIRRADTAFRIGGEEFLILLYDTDIKGGQGVAEDIRSEIESLSLLTDRTVTTSIGVATLQADEDREAWMKRCDENLYRAKNNGRNQVIA